MATYKVDALILKKRNYQEADRIVTIFGRGTGKETVRARAVRKIKSKLAGHLETFTRADLLIAEGKGFDIIAQAQTHEAFSHLRHDFVRMAEAFYGFELLDKVTPEGYKDSALFDFMVKYLRAINDAHHDHLTLIRHAMEIQLLETLGFAPQFQRCEKCNEKFDGLAFFHSADGVFYHKDHKPLGVQTVQVSFDTLKVLQFLLKNTFEQIQKLAIPKNIPGELESVLVHMIHDVSEKRINSKKLLK
jgi:DNA repair protein RecO (recombination protein O)